MLEVDQVVHADGLNGHAEFGGGVLCLIDAKHYARGWYNSTE